MAAPHSSAAKRAARARALAARAGCAPECGEHLARHVLAALPLPAGATVSGFWPMQGEIDIRPLLQALHDRGHRVLLPATPPLGRPLVFHAWRPGAAMVRERFGTWRPQQDGIGTPEVLFVPLLAFDRRGHRLGYGGGYYDRTLALLPDALRIGCAFAAQELDEVPAEAHDIRLHAVATERGVIRFEDL